MRLREIAKIRQLKAKAWKSFSVDKKLIGNFFEVVSMDGFMIPMQEYYSIRKFCKKYSLEDQEYLISYAFFLLSYVYGEFNIITRFKKHINIIDHMSEEEVNHIKAFNELIKLWIKVKKEDQRISEIIIKKDKRKNNIWIPEEKIKITDSHTFEYFLDFIISLTPKFDILDVKFLKKVAEHSYSLDAYGSDIKLFALNLFNLLVEGNKRINKDNYIIIAEFYKISGYSYLRVKSLNLLD